MRIAIRASLVLALVAVPLAAAAQAPPIIPFQGYLTDAGGTPRSGEVVVEVDLYDASVDGNLLAGEGLVVDAVEGYFTAELGTTDQLDLAIFRDNSEVWAEITIDGDVLQPRIQFGSVPYAAWADFAGEAATVDGMSAEELAATFWEDIEGVPDDIADGDDVAAAGEGIIDTDGVFSVDAAVVQARVGGVCDEGSSVREILEDGSVVCEADDDTLYDAGTGLGLLDGFFSVDFESVQARVAGSCEEGSAIRELLGDGTVVCEADDDTTYTAGDGLTVIDGEFAVDTSIVQARLDDECGPGEFIRAVDADGAVTCGTDVDTDTDTTYTPGLGLLLDGTEFSLDMSAVQVRVSACPPGSAIRAVAMDGTVTCEIDDDTDTDTDTTYSAGTGLDLTDTVFSVDPGAVQTRVGGVCDPGSAIREVLGDGTVVCETDDGDSYSAGTAIDITAGVISVADESVGAAQITDESVGSAEILDGSVGADEVADGSLTEDEINLQGVRVVGSTTAENIWARLLVNSSLAFTHFRIMITVNGLTGGGSTVPGGSGVVLFDLAQDCQTAYGGDQTITVSGTPSGGYPRIYMSDEFEVGGVACFASVKVSADSAAQPVVVRDVELVPTAWEP